MGRKHLAHLGHVHLHVVGVHACHALLQVLWHVLHHTSSPLATTDQHLQALELLCKHQQKLKEATWQARLLPVLLGFAAVAAWQQRDGNEVAEKKGKVAYKLKQADKSAQP